MRSSLILLYLFLSAPIFAQETPIAVLREPGVMGAKLRLTSAVYSPDGSKIVTASEDGLARVWNAKTYSANVFCLQGDAITPKRQRPGTKKPNLPWIRDAQFSPNSENVILAGPHGNVWIWKLKDGSCESEKLFFLTGHSEDARTAEFSKDGTKIVTTSDDTTVKVWSSSGELLHTLNLETPVFPKAFTTSASFSPDNKTIIATRSDGLIAKIDAETYESKVIRDGTSNNMAIWQTSFLPHEQSFVTASEDGEVAIWNLSGTKMKTLRPAMGPGVNTVAVNPDGSLAVVGFAAQKELGKPSYAIVIRISDGQQLLRFNGSAESISKVSFSPDGSKVLMSSYDGTATIWSVR